MVAPYIIIVGVVVIVAIVLPPLTVAMASGWTALAVVCAFWIVVLGYASYELTKPMALDGPGAPFAAVIGVVGKLTLLVVWGVFLLAGSAKAYDIVRRARRPSR